MSILPIAAVNLDGQPTRTIQVIVNGEDGRSAILRAAERGSDDQRIY